MRRNHIPAETITAIIEDTRFLLDADYSPGQVARRLGYTTTGLERLLRRHGQPQLASVFGREAQRWGRAA